MKQSNTLKMWEKARDLAISLYETTKTFPVEQIIGLTSQLRKAAISISSNISDGFEKREDVDKCRIFQEAFGNANEVESLLLFASNSGIISKRNFKKLAYKLIEVKQMLASFN